jgi:pimeloyl-ACP methyl ester carboxylesterase
VTQHVTANGLQLAYETFGSAEDPPLLLVMGLGTQMIGWRDAFCELLADQGFFVVRFDNRDVGESTHLDDLPVPNPIGVLLGRTEPVYRIQDMATDTLSLMDALGLDRVHLMGASMGGFITQHVALAQPHRIASLTLMMTSTGSRRVGGTHPKVIAAILRRKPVTNREDAVQAAWSMLQLTQSPAYTWSEDDISPVFGLAYDRGYDPEGSSRQFAAIVAQDDRTAALADLDIPTVVLHGLADRMVNFSGGVSLARTIPGARLVAFHGMGHDLPPALWPEFAAEVVKVSRRADAITADT